MAVWLLWCIIGCSVDYFGTCNAFYKGFGWVLEFLGRVLGTLGGPIVGSLVVLGGQMAKKSGKRANEIGLGVSNKSSFEKKQLSATSKSYFQSFRFLFFGFHQFVHILLNHCTVCCFLRTLCRCLKPVINRTHCRFCYRWFACRDVFVYSVCSAPLVKEEYALCAD